MIWFSSASTHDEKVGFHHGLNGHESEQVLGDSEGHGSLAYCSPWDHKESDTTERLNNSIILKFSGKILVYLIEQEPVLD